MMRFINRLEEILITVLLAFMTLLTFSQVIARYIFNSGAVWALEVTSYAFAGLVLLGASYLIRCGGHIAVDSLVDLMPKAIRKKVAIFAVLVCFTFALLMFIGSYQYVYLLYDIGIEMLDVPFPEWIAKLTMPLGFLMMMFRLLQVLLLIIANRHDSMHFDHKL